MIKLSPSLLAADPLHLGDALALTMDAGCEELHFDVMDAHFVPNLTFGPHILAGVFYIVGIDYRKLVSLPDDLMEHYMDKFWEPETYTEKDVDQAFWKNWVDEIDRMLQVSEI